ncbi:colicin E3/pyocin S6 family cytotoxin [Enterobacter sp. Bisph1]
MGSCLVAAHCFLCAASFPDHSERNHLGEFDPITGEQTKPADPTRKVEK